VTPFTHLEAVAAPLPLSNVDTDQIIPARFLHKPRRDGYEDFLFRDFRFDADDRPRPDFVLNQPATSAARILVAGANFGCGSSREGAVYALWDFGFRTVIAPSFGDIFHGNALKNGLLPVTLPEQAVASLLAKLKAAPGQRLAVDLSAQSVVHPDGDVWRFEIDPFIKQCLLRGIDELDYTLALSDRISAYEARGHANI
jgi:3-isopropylmalate/(R)-2-methylmalate dehydratase small subunit